MTPTECSAEIRKRLPRLGGDPRSYVAIPISVLTAVLSELEHREPAQTVTPLADIEVAAVLDLGAGVPRARLPLEADPIAGAMQLAEHVAAIERHLQRYRDGQRLDHVTGLRALAHVAARAHLATECELRAKDQTP